MSKEAPFQHDKRTPLERMQDDPSEISGYRESYKILEDYTDDEAAAFVEIYNLQASDWHEAINYRSKPVMATLKDSFLSNLDDTSRKEYQELYGLSDDAGDEGLWNALEKKVVEAVRERHAEQAKMREEKEAA